MQIICREETLYLFALLQVHHQAVVRRYKHVCKKRQWQHKVSLQIKTRDIFTSYQLLWLFIYLHIINRFTNQSERCVPTVDVRHHQHLRLRQSLLQVVEVDGAVEGEEAHPGARIPWQPERQYKYKNHFLSELVQTEKKHLLVVVVFPKDSLIQVVEQRFTQVLQVTWLHCIVGYVEDEQVDGRLRRSQLRTQRKRDENKQTNIWLEVM